MNYQQIAENLIELCKFTNDFALVDRDKIKNDETCESDAEHSYQLAMVAWYLSSKLNLNLDQNKLIKYALVHDLVETYAGDVQSYAKSRDQKIKETQEDKEKESMKRIENEFPDFPEMSEYIKNYENKTDDEAILIRALDKLIPMIFVHNSTKDNFFKKHKINFDEMYKERTSRGITDSKEVFEIFKILVKKFEDEGMFFNK